MEKRGAGNFGTHDAERIRKPGPKKLSSFLRNYDGRRSGKFRETLYRVNVPLCTRHFSYYDPGMVYRGGLYGEEFIPAFLVRPVYTSVCRS